ncbi:hypothetical protein V3C99_004256 [Haemonchus contortus]
MSGLQECWRSRFRGYTGKYHMFLPMDMIDRSTVGKFLASECLAGIITYDVSSINGSKPLSHDSECPNSESGFSKGCTFNVWNREGAILPEGLRNIDWNMQILYIHNQTYIDTIRKCYELFNVPYNDSSSVTFPFCAASFGIFSKGAGSSEICMRRNGLWPEYLSFFTSGFSTQCGPLKGMNIMVHIPPKVHNDTTDSQPATRYLMLTARMDGFGLIPEISPGEISVVTSVIALLAVIQIIGENFALFEEAALASNRHLLIAFFDGEAFDYIGSSRVAYDMMNGVFPRVARNNLNERLETIFLSQLDGIIEVQQLGSGDGQRLYAHSDGSQVVNGQVLGLLTSMQAGVTAAGGILVSPTKYSEMPPSSWNSFAKINSSIPGLVLAPYHIEYKYLRFNSMLDRAQWDPTQRSAAISEIVMAASALLRAAADHVVLDADAKSKLQIDGDFVSMLINCFIDSPDWFSCDYLDRITGKRHGDQDAYNGKSTYVKVGEKERLRFHVQTLTMYLTGTTAHNHSEEKGVRACRQSGRGQNVYTYNLLTDIETNISHCYRTPVHFYVALSPAFLIEDYDYSNSTYSTWTEATYNIADLQLFLIQDQSFDYVMIAIGIFFLVLSFMVVCRCTEESIMLDEEDEEEEEEEEKEEEESKSSD